LLEDYQVHPSLKAAILALPDLYGGREVLEEARNLPLSSRAQADLDWLEATLALIPQVPILLDLGRARRLTFYTGMNFQAYTPDFGLPILGGGRYDGALLPYAAGFALSLERVMEALRLPASSEAPEVLALDRAMAHKLRAEGKRVEMAWTSNLADLREYARMKGIRWLAKEGKLEEIK
jgi:ATP phosphoribosyltransferase regulatory subunit